MELNSVMSNEVSKPSAPENKSFDPDKRIDVNQKQDTKESSGFDVDKRVENAENKHEVKKTFTDKLYTTEQQRIDLSPKMESEKGKWTDDRGNSKFIPDTSTEDGKKAAEKLAQYGQDGINYRNGVIDYSKSCEATVKIDNMSETRWGKGGNFEQADTKLAEQWNKGGKDNRNDWTAREVADYRRDNKLSWHERPDMKHCDLVSQDIHGNGIFSHSGGCLECKIRDSVNSNNKFGGGFDE